MGKKITPRNEDYSKWYNDIVSEAGLAESSAVRGCMVIKPYGFSIWELMKSQLDKMFKDTGHENAYFPLFVPKSLFEAEEKNAEGFAKECAVVTHYRLKNDPDKKGKLIVDPDSKLEEELIVRPTSEAIIWSTYKNWIQSYRDLPILINQWANVVRWEMRTRLFLRTSEFLWQEGHTAHQTKEEATQEALQMLDIYEEFTEKIAAVKVIKGTKSEIEKFAGAKVTYSIEAMMLDKKALQAGTSHELGQNFSKAFEIQYSDENNNLAHPFQTSWGVSTRLIGMIIMAHGDDQCLKLPPAIAPTQVVIIPIIPKNADSEKILKLANQIKEMLSDFRVHLDDREEVSPGFKFNEWELKGVPIRLELGPKDIENQSMVLAKRYNLEKMKMGLDEVEKIVTILDEIQTEMLKKAKTEAAGNTIDIENYDEFKMKMEKGGFFNSPWCGKLECEEKIKEETGAEIRVIPFNSENTSKKCIYCKQQSTSVPIFARGY